MSKDIVTRLIESNDYYGNEAADEIESLRRQIADSQMREVMLRDTLFGIRDGSMGLWGDDLINCNKALAATEPNEQDNWEDNQSPIEESYVDPDANKTPAQLRAEGRAYCPKCYTFGDSHNKDCPHKNEGMTKHIRTRSTK